MCNTNSSSTGQRKEGFTLLEVVVAMTIFATGIVALLSGVSTAVHSSSRATDLRRAVELADRELSLATSFSANGLQDYVRTFGKHELTVSYRATQENLVQAVIVVTWRDRDKTRIYVLPQWFAPLHVGAS